MKTISFARINEEIKIPTKRIGDAGYDIYPYFQEEFMLIQPHETKIIPTGLYSMFDKDYVVILKERGSTGTKGIGQKCGVIDSIYRGEWLVPITNHNDKPLVIHKDLTDQKKMSLEKDYIVYPYEKAICQAIIFELPKFQVQEVPLAVIENSKTERGAGKLGSSGK